MRVSSTRMDSLATDARHLEVSRLDVLCCNVTRRENSRGALLSRRGSPGKTRKFRGGESSSLPRFPMTCGWHGIVRRGPVAERERTSERRAAAPGIGFNAHCYQRREDATQLHCLAGLVTAGDIINRLRASPFCVRPAFNHSHSVREWKELR